MTEFLLLFSNREIATVFWIFIFFAFYIFNKKESRKSFYQVIKLIFLIKFIPIYFIFLIYFIGIILFLKKINIWEFYLYKDFLIWFIGTGIILFFNSNKFKTYSDFNKVTVKIFSINQIFTFSLNFYNFSILGEFILIHILMLLTALYIYSNLYKERKEYLQVSKLIKGLLTIIVIIIIIHAFYNFIISYNKLLTINNLKSFLLPLSLTLLFLPIIYMIVIYMKYEDLFFYLNGYTFLDVKRKANIKYAILRYGNIRINKLDNAKEIILRNKYELKENANIKKYIKTNI